MSPYILIYFININYTCIIFLIYASVFLKTNIIICFVKRRKHVYTTKVPYQHNSFMKYWDHTIKYLVYTEIHKCIWYMSLGCNYFFIKRVVSKRNVVFDNFVLYNVLCIAEINTYGVL
jgi:hypothetical protein